MLIIMRGVPGSGKSTKAKELAGEYADRGVIICSADSYMVDGSGSYFFNPKLLHHAHKSCQDKARMALESGYFGVVIIDNTNTQLWEMEPYKALAKEFSVPVTEVLVGNLDEDSLKLYAERNLHGCPLDQIKKMAQRFERE